MSSGRHGGSDDSGRDSSTGGLPHELRMREPTSISMVSRGTIPLLAERATSFDGGTATDIESASWRSYCWPEKNDCSEIEKGNPGNILDGLCRSARLGKWFPVFIFCWIEGAAFRRSEPSFSSYTEAIDGSVKAPRQVLADGRLPQRAVSVSGTLPRRRGLISDLA